MVNINGVVNFIKLENKTNELNFIVMMDDYDDVKCDNSDDNIDIDKFLLNFIKTTTNKYSLYFYDWIENNKFSYYDNVAKIPNKIKEFNNINIINYEKPIENSILLRIEYKNIFHFTIRLVREYYNYLESLSKNLNLLLNNNNKTTKENKIILDNIYTNYYINKIKETINNINIAQKYIDANIISLKTNNYEKLKQIYRMKEDIYLNIEYIINFNTIYNLIIEILLSTKNKHIINIKFTNICMLLPLLIRYFNYEIIYISYSDRIVDNGSLVIINKIFKNSLSINFLKKYLANYNKSLIISCINLDSSILK